MGQYVYSGSLVTPFGSRDNMCNHTTAHYLWTKQIYINFLLWDHGENLYKWPHGWKYTDAFASGLVPVQHAIVDLNKVCATQAEKHSIRTRVNGHPSVCWTHTMLWHEMSGMWDASWSRHPGGNFKTHRIQVDACKGCCTSCIVAYLWFSLVFIVCWMVYSGEGTTSLHKMSA